MVNGQKIMTAVSAAIESRAYFTQSIAECLEKEFGEEEWYPVIAIMSSKTGIDLPSIVDNYYKKKDSVSIELVVDSSVKELFLENKENQIYKRLFRTSNGLDKIKSSYIKSNNNNFAILLKTETDMGISSIGKSEFQSKVGLMLELLRWEMMYRFPEQKIKDILKSIASEPTIKEANSIINLIYSNLRSKVASQLRNDRVRNIYDFIRRDLSVDSSDVNYSLATLNNFVINMNTSKEALSLIVKAMAYLIAKQKEKDLLSLSSFVNNTLDYPSRIAEELNLNSYAVKYQWTNPVSGHISIKTKRDQKAESTLSKEEFDKLVETHRMINRIYEESVSLVNEYKIKKKLDKETVVRLVSGEEIISLYEITSYYNYQNIVNTGGGGTLYNSCMRHIGYKNRISAYANNPHMVKMLALVTKSTNKLKARAVVWYDDEKDIHYVDRIFYYDEDSKNQIKVFVNEHKNFISIYSGNGISRSQSSFLIPFKYAIPSADGPFLDSIRHNIIVNSNGDRFIGAPGSSDYIETQNRWYFTGLIDKEVNISRNKCVCCSSMTDNKVGEIYACKRHLRLDGDGKPYLTSGTKIIYPYGMKNEGTGDDDEKYVLRYSSAKPNFMRPEKSLNELNLSNEDGSNIRVVSGTMNQGSSGSQIIYKRVKTEEGRLEFDRYDSVRRIFYDDTVVPIHLEKNTIFLAVKDESSPAFKDSIRALAATIEFLSIGDQQLTALKNETINEIMKERFIRNYTKKEWDSRIGKINMLNPITQINNTGQWSSGMDFFKTIFIDENNNSESVNDIGISTYLTIPGTRLAGITIPVSIIGGDLELATKMVNDAKKGN